MQSDNDDEHWFYKSWRPAVAWCYLFLCMFDFFIAPIALTLFCWYTGVPYIPWEPLTLKGGSVLHASMGGIAGIAAWSRGREKIASMELDRRFDDTNDNDKNKDSQGKDKV